MHKSYEMAVTQLRLYISTVWYVMNHIMSISRGTLRACLWDFRKANILAVNNLPIFVSNDDGSGYAMC